MEKGVLFGIGTLLTANTLRGMYTFHMANTVRDIRWLEEQCTYNATKAEEFSMHAETEKYYLDKLQRCTEEIDQINKWNLDNGIVMRTFKRPPSIDYMYIDSGIRFD